MTDAEIAELWSTLEPSKRERARSTKFGTLAHACAVAEACYLDMCCRVTCGNERTDWSAARSLCPLTNITDAQLAMEPTLFHGGKHAR